MFRSIGDPHPVASRAALDGDDDMWRFDTVNGPPTPCRSAPALALLAMWVAACAPHAPGPAGVDEDATFSITLAWDAPQVNDDGSALTDLEGYRLYYSRSSPLDLATASRVEIDTRTVHTLSGLSAGTYHFVVSAFDLNGNDSAPTPEISATVGPP